MPDLTKSHRLYGVTIHDGTTKQVCVPEYEIGIIKAAWRGKEIIVQPTSETREVLTDPRIGYNDLLKRYDARAVAQFFPGPERLEIDMQASADKTASWLEDCKRKETEAARAREAARAKDSDKGSDKGSNSQSTNKPKVA